MNGGNVGNKYSEACLFSRRIRKNRQVIINMAIVIKHVIISANNDDNVVFNKEHYNRKLPQSKNNILLNL